MSKKILIKPRSSFTQPISNAIPQDVEDKLDAWISKPTPVEKLTEKKITNTPSSPLIHKLVRLNFNIDDELHSKLKMYCFEHKTTIKELCVSLLKEKITNL